MTADVPTIALVVLLSIGVVVGAVLLIRRLLYVRSLRARGWTFTGSPTLEITHGLNCPPFGLGYDRRVDDLVSGRTSSGVPFLVFQYGAAGRLAVLPLAGPLPEAFVGTAARPGARGEQVPAGRWLVTAADPVFGQALIGTIGPSLDALAAGGHPVDVSVDGASLVALGVPADADEMAAFLEALAPAATAVGRSDLHRFAAPAPPSELSLYRRPDWVYRPADNGPLDLVTVTGGGFDHTAQDVVLAEVAGLRMVGLTHRWKTTRTVTETDSQGHTRTRTETDHHSEPVLEFALPWRFGELSVNWPGFGNRVHFESSDFEREFTVRCLDPRFASAVFHPRQLEFLLRARPLPFEINRAVVRFDLGVNTPDRIEHCADFLVAFFAGVPRFVWQDHGLPEPPVDPELAGF